MIDCPRTRVAPAHFVETTDSGDEISRETTVVSLGHPLGHFLCAASAVPKITPFPSIQVLVTAAAAVEHG